MSTSTLGRRNAGMPVLAWLQERMTLWRHDPLLPPRSLLTAHLDDALDRDMCPLCYLRNEAEYRHLDMLLYERVNDEAARQALAQVHGFCRHHTARLLQVGGYGSHVKVAIIYKALIDAVSGEIDALSSNEASGIEMGGECPVCRTARDTEHRHAELLARRLADATFAAAYAEAEGLCMPHFVVVYDSASPRVREALRKDQLRKLVRLSGELGEFIHKSVVQTEPFGNARDAWIRAVRRYAGTTDRHNARER
ncbi:MAG: hypothetical protein FJZ90_15425 [Chloroflexi bacterium]|nr:hypothetical protein [Chloroflexota bacterium]